MTNKKFKLIAKLAKKERTLNDVLKARGIVPNHPSLGFFHFILSPIENANLNKVRLAEKAVEESIQQLRMTQCNPNHDREVVHAAIVDAWRNKFDEIEIVVAFFKNIFPEAYDQNVKWAKENKLFISFELCTNPDTVEVLGDGTKRVNEIFWEGCGILTPDNPPAYPNAKTLEYANLEEVNDVVNKIFHETNEIVFASANDVINKLSETSKKVELAIKSNKENSIMSDKFKEQLLAEFKKSLVAELGEEVKSWSTEQLEAELSRRTKEEITAEKTVIETDKQTNTKTTYDNDTNTETEEVIEVVVQKRDGKEVFKRKTNEERMYTYADLEAEVAKAKDEVKAEYEAKIAEKDTIIASKDDKELKDQLLAKDTILASKETIIADKDKVIAEKDNEIKSLTEKAEFYKENAKKIAEIRAELGDYVKELADDQLFNEDKIKIARLEKQIAENTTPTPKVTPTKMVAKIEGDNLAVKEETYTKLVAKQAVEKRN